jgi:hypothetical protein
MATQLSIIRGDTFPTQTITVTSANLDFANITCTGQLRPHPDGYYINLCQQRYQV